MNKIQISASSMIKLRRLSKKLKRTAAAQVEKMVEDYCAEEDLPPIPAGFNRKHDS